MVDLGTKYSHPTNHNIAAYLSKFTGETIDPNCVRYPNNTLFWKAEHVPTVGCNIIVKNFIIIANETTAKDIAEVLYCNSLKHKMNMVLEDTNDKCQ